MEQALRKIVSQRAGDRCEYCHLPQNVHEERFSIDHVIPRKHGGGDTPENLALSCLRCNVFKGTDLAAIDPDTGAVVPVFNPRMENWENHFQTQGDSIVGLTPCGPATVKLLNMNAPERRALRAALGGAETR